MGQGITNGQDTVIVAYDYIDANGVLRGGTAEVEVETPVGILEYTQWNVTTLVNNGPTDKRIDLVFLGDGYDVNDINDGIYANHVNNVIVGLFAELPFDEYYSFFNVHQVDVISNESGVDYDPCGPFSPDPNLKDTELDMRFWENNIERLLGITFYKAESAANQAIACDFIFALANSSKYGGAGYLQIPLTKPIALLSGGNEQHVELALHEFGHSFGQLEDEYWEGTGHYYGSEPEYIPNLSIYEASEMLSRQTKWYIWLSEENVDTFPGGWRSYATGIYRPTEWSMMRALRYEPNHPDYPNDIPFFQVNVEQFIFKIYDEIVSPIDDATEPGTYAVGTASTDFFVEPVQPATHSLDVQWYLDGNSIPGATGTTLDASTLDMSPGRHTLDVNVIDNTDLVQDEGERERLMSDSRTWTLMKKTPVAYWKLDETSGTIAADSSIYDNNGILNNMDPNTDWVAGKINGALHFDGEDDYVSLSPIPVLEGDTVTVSAWIKADDVNEGLHPIVTQFEQVGGNYFGYYFYVSGNKPKFYLEGSIAESPNSIKPNVWYHLAGTNDGNELKIYVNGELKDTNSVVGFTGIYHDAYIGHDDVFPSYFTGKIDDVRIYNWALDANEVWELSYESDADFNGDDIVNFLDYAVFADAWQTTPADDDYNDIYDLVDNNSIDYADLAIFCEDWLWQAGGAMMMGQGMSQGFRLMEGLYLSAPAKQPQAQIEPLDIEYMIKWLEELWLDEEVRKVITEDAWLKFMELIKEGL